ncbi:MAG TPA: DUF2254 domain-containing protein [Allosphingosinicella sp.]|nr:DUF2254 domain-containing protein [Allosphingosinicella sp.]
MVLLIRSGGMGGAITNWVRASWDAIRTSLWLIPGVMFLIGASLALFLLRLDEQYFAGASWQTWIATGDGEDARNLLSTLLGAVIAMASIVFSVTVVSLSLAANAYGSRLIRTFRSNRRTQLVLGMFMMTIVYLLLALRAVRGGAGPAEVPDLAVAVGSALALICVLALLAFIQGVATLLVADEVIRRVRREFDSAIDALPAADRPTQAPAAELPGDFEERAARIRLPREGYVQAVAYAEIVSWAEKHDVLVRLDFRPGDFVVEGDRKLLIYPPPADPARARRELDRFIVSGQQRTPTQDLEFAIRHLVEVAVRALSPGINDPFTAMAVIDRLRGGLARLCARQLPAKAIEGGLGKLRLIRDATSYGGAVDAAFDQIRQAGAAKPSILIHMLRAIGAIAEHTRTDEQRSALAKHADMAFAAAVREVRDASDRHDVEQALRSAMRALQNSSG